MKYSLVLRGDPRAPEKGKKAFASAQCHQVVSLEELAHRIKLHGCVYSEGDLQAVTTILADAVIEQLRNGNQVELGKLGKFYVTLDCTGADTLEDFDPKQHIHGLRPHWMPSKSFDHMRDNLTFEETTDRRTERRCLQDSRRRRQNGEPS